MSSKNGRNSTWFMIFFMPGSHLRHCRLTLDYQAIRCSSNVWRDFHPVFDAQKTYSSCDVANQIMFVWTWQERFSQKKVEELDKHSQGRIISILRVDCLYFSATISKVICPRQSTEKWSTMKTKYQHAFYTAWCLLVLAMINLTDWKAQINSPLTVTTIKM